MTKRFACATAVLGFAACLMVRGLAASADPTTQPTVAAVPTTQPVNKICPVTKDAIDPNITVVYDGKVIAFCCKDCVDKFKADPQKYLKDLK